MKTNTLLVLAFLLQGYILEAQNQSANLSMTEKKQVIDSTAFLLRKSYIFEDKANEMANLITSNLGSGKYDAIDDPAGFGDRLTADLRSVSHDKHLAVAYAPERVRQIKAAQQDTSAVPIDGREERMSNYGFEEVKILSGNVGYLKLNSFSEAQEGLAVAVAAMNFLANTDALIIDLTQNGGGSPQMIQLISSYLFDQNMRHLNSFYNREAGQTTQTWTLPFVPGRKLTDKSVYILTSSYTFSAAEEFTYNLKNMERATIVGETTGGGAHPLVIRPLNDNFLIGLPFMRAINPVTNTNWEGTGIEPDLACAASEAFDLAYLTALTRLREAEKDETYRNIFNWSVDGLKSKLEPVILSVNEMKTLTGTYGSRVITFENGSLYYQREGRPRFRMEPMGRDTFSLTGLDNFRLRFIREADKVVALEGYSSNGQTSRNEKTK